MSRKIRIAKQQRAELPAPAITFYVLTGEHAPGRIDGWVEEAQMGFSTPGWAEIIEMHREALVAEARAHGFRAYCETGCRPTGAAFEQWRSDFLHTHTY
jgi:hypothetical protein